jgi:hypothetical protein
MRHLAVALSAVVLVACSKKDEAATPAADSTRPSLPAASPMTPEAVAGNWRVQVMGESGDSVLLAYDMTASADTAGWTITLPGREPMKLTIVSMGGDSAVAENGPYESVLRPGVQVRTTTTLRLRGDRLVGRTVARYSSAGADSVVNLRSRGQRVP